MYVSKIILKPVIILFSFRKQFSVFIHQTKNNSYL